MTEIPEEDNLAVDRPLVASSLRRYTPDGREVVVLYDPEAPCLNCGEPVIEGSMGGTAICPWCDVGKTDRHGNAVPFRMKGIARDDRHWEEMARKREEYFTAHPSRRTQIVTPSGEPVEVL